MVLTLDQAYAAFESCDEVVVIPAVESLFAGALEANTEEEVGNEEEGAGEEADPVKKENWFKRVLGLIKKFFVWLGTKIAGLFKRNSKSEAVEVSKVLYDAAKQAYSIVKGNPSMDDIYKATTIVQTAHAKEKTNPGEKVKIKTSLSNSIVKDIEKSKGLQSKLTSKANSIKAEKDSAKYNEQKKDFDQQLSLITRSIQLKAQIAEMLAAKGTVADDEE